jgi:uncharacterized protein involved in tolerance to divalent cations
MNRLEVATSVLEARLAACVNFIPQVKSMYWWDGKLNTDSEILLMMKTKTALIPGSNFITAFAVCTALLNNSS